MTYRTDYPCPDQEPLTEIAYVNGDVSCLVIPYFKPILEWLPLDADEGHCDVRLLGHVTHHKCEQHDIIIYRGISKELALSLSSPAPAIELVCRALNKLIAKLPSRADCPTLEAFAQFIVAELADADIYVEWDGDTFVPPKSEEENLGHQH